MGIRKEPDSKKYNLMGLIKGHCAFKWQGRECCLGQDNRRFICL